MVGSNDSAFVGRPRLLAHSQDTQVQGLGFRVSPLGKIETGEIVQARSNPAVPSGERRFVHRDDATKEALGFGEASLDGVDLRQRADGIGMFRKAAGKRDLTLLPVRTFAERYDG